MVMCKFYLQGTCKFGSSCKFDHGDPYHYTNPNATSILRQQGGTVDTSVLVKTVVNEATATEKGGQWLLSCYAPFKEKPPFPGLEDTSFEEVRWGFYEARQKGTLDQYMRQIQEMLQTRMMQLKSFQNPSPEIVTILKNIYDTPASSSFGLNTQIADVNRTGGFAVGQSKLLGNSTFGQSTVGNNSVFGQSTAANNSTFGQTTAANNSTFGQSIAANNSTFGQASSTNIFGGFGQQSSTGFAQQNQPIFGGAAQTQNTPFGQPPPNQNIFAGAQQPQQQASNSIFGKTPLLQSGSIFGQAQPQQTGNIFAATPQNPVASGNLFAPTTQPQASIFATQQQPQQQQQTNIFAAQQGSIFGQAQQPTQQALQQQSMQPPTQQLLQQPTQQALQQHSMQPPTQQASQPPQQSLFGNVPQLAGQPPQQQPNQFGGQNNTPFAGASPFMQQPQQQPFLQPQSSAQHSQNIFGGAFTQKQDTPIVDPSIYSKLEELTPEEINWFNSDTLDVASIPENPPTFEMCH